jgi:general secretion pathway protein A
VEKFPAPNPFGRAPAGSSSLLTYEPYYGLREKPFSLSTDPRFLYRSPEHTRTFEDLFLAIRRREGLIVLTGDIGTGKTTLCRAVLEELDRKTFTTFVPDPFITREDLLKRLLLDFGVMSVDDLKSGRMTGASHSELSYPLYEFLKSLVPLQAFAALIIDETQNLSLPLLEEIRILADLESPEKLLQVVLVGQLELRAKLKLPEMRQLDQRVSARCTLQALNRDALSGYISHRLHVAGGSDDRVMFAPEAVDAVFRASNGVPRVTNLICDRALYLCYLQRKNVIDAESVTQAIDDLGVGQLTAAPDVEPVPAAPPPQPAAAAIPAPAVRAEGSLPGSDLSGLDVHDIADDLSSPIAAAVAPEPGAPYTPILTLRSNSNRALLDESPSARRWRHRARRVAVAVAVLIALASVLIFGQVMLMTYNPEEQALPVPSAPRPPAIAAPPMAIPVPADLLLSESAGDPGQPASAANPLVE